MRVSFACSVLLVSTLLFNCQAQTDPARPTGNADLSKEAWVIERSVSTITVEDSGCDVRELTAEIRLLAEAGVKQFAVLNFTYTSANEAVEVDYVRVRKPDGTVVNTPDYNIQDMPAAITRTAPLYSDIREKHVAVKGLGVGDVLEYRIRSKKRTPQVPGQVWYEYNLTTDQIVREEKLEVSVPRGMHIHVKSPAFKPEMVEEGNRRVYKWKHASLQRKEEEETGPKRSTPSPDIQISTFTNWEEIGRWYSELQKEQIAVTPAIARKAEELTRGSNTDDDKLRAIYNFVALRVHYIGLDFGIGRYKPHAAEEVLENEYGDCKDKHTLLAALLKAAGFDAWPVLIHTSQKLDAEIPSPAQFDHVITVVPRGKDVVWLDTTIDVAPLGFLIPQLRDKQALVIPTGKAALLQTTPANPPFPQQQVFSAVAKLDANGVLKGHIVRRFRGDLEVVLRSALRQVPEAKWQEGIQGLSRAAGFGGDVSNVVISPIEELQKPLEISYDYLRKNYSDWEHKQILSLLPPMGIEAERLKEKPPKDPVYLGALGEIIYTSEIELPSGSSLSPPKNVDIVEPYAEYHTQNRLESGRLKTERRFIIKKTEVAVAEWESFKKMSKAASDDSFNYIALSGLGEDANSLWEKGTQARKSGDYERAIELLKQAVEADPKSNDAWNELGLVYLEPRRYQLAMDAFQKQVEINPSHEYAYNNLGRVYLHTLQYELAIAAFKKQIQINPKDEYAHNNLGLVYLRQHKYDDAIQCFRNQLEVSPDDKFAHGNLADAYLQQKRYVEAAPELEQALNLSPASVGLRVSLAEAYARSGQKEKASVQFRAAADAIEKYPVVDYMRLNDIAYSMAEVGVDLDRAKQCIEKALEELDTRSNAAANEGPPRYALTRGYGFLWDTAGWVYFKMGDLTRAESYVRAAWLLTQQGIVGEHLAEVYEKLGKTKEAAHTYELAYAAMGTVPGPAMAGAGISPIAPADQSAQELAKDHYQKLTGKPLNTNSVARLPNGQWPTSPAVELSQLREAKLGPEPGPNNSADFEIRFTSGGAAVATFLSGNTEMKLMKKRLESAKFKVEIPVGSKATIYRRATVHCSKWSPCSAVLTPLETISIVTLR